MSLFKKLFGKKTQSSESLLEAVDHGSVSQVAAILSNGADPNTSDGIMALSGAVFRGDPKLVDILLKGGAKTDPSDAAELPLFTAIGKGHEQVVRVLLKAGANTKGNNKWGHTALTYAISERQTAIVGLLLDAGAKVDRPTTASNMDGWTPLMVASWEGLGDVARELIRRGAKVNATGSGGTTAMHKAAWHGHVDLIVVLCQAGGDVSARDRQGQTPSFYAEHNGHAEAAMRLVQLESETHR